MDRTRETLSKVVHRTFRCVRAAHNGNLQHTILKVDQTIDLIDSDAWTSRTGCGSLDISLLRRRSNEKSSAHPPTKVKTKYLYMG